MYELYIANKNYSSWSLRPWLLMRELAIPFKEHLMPFERGSSWAAFRDFSPTGKVPCLRDGNAAIWDSLAISEYLAERHRGVWPADGGARAWWPCRACKAGIRTGCAKPGANRTTRTKPYAPAPGCRICAYRQPEMPVFKLLGFAVFAYTVYALIQGRIYSKAGPWGRMVSKDESPDAFWLTVAIYFGLSIALCAVF